MVSRRGHIGWVILALLLLPLVVAAAPAPDPVPDPAPDPALRVTLSAPRVELGKSFQLRVSAPANAPALAELDLAPLSRDFVVEEREAAVDTATGRQTLRLRLSPTATGTLRLPALQLGPLHSAPMGIEVTPAVDPKVRAPVYVRTQVDTRTPWQGQQVRLRMEITAPVAILKLQRDAPDIPGVRLLPLPRSTEAVIVDGRAMTRHVLQWALFVDTPGTRRLRLPAVAYVRDGIVTHRFHFPDTVFEVHPLPIYVPPTMNIGRVSVEHLDALPRLGFSQELMVWRLRLRGEGVPAARLPDVSALHGGTDAMLIYPPRVRRRDEAAHGGLRGEAVFDVPFKVVRSGLVRSPEVVVRYFDPVRGVLGQSRLPSRLHLFLPRWLAWSLAVVLLPILARLAWRLAARLWRRWRKLAEYTRILRALAEADSPHALRACIARSAAVEGWPPGLSVRGWHGRWQATYGAVVPAPMASFHAALYGGKGGDGITEDMRQCLQALFRYRRRHLCGLAWARRGGISRAGAGRSRRLRRDCCPR